MNKKMGIAQRATLVTSGALSQAEVHACDSVEDARKLIEIKRSARTSATREHSYDRARREAEQADTRRAERRAAAPSVAPKKPRAPLSKLELTNLMFILFAGPDVEVIEYPRAAR